MWALAPQASVSAVPPLRRSAAKATTIIKQQVPALRKRKFQKMELLAPSPTPPARLPTTRRPDRRRLIAKLAARRVRSLRRQLSGRLRRPLALRHPACGFPSAERTCPPAARLPAASRLRADGPPAACRLPSAHARSQARSKTFQQGTRQNAVRLVQESDTNVPAAARCGRTEALPTGEGERKRHEHAREPARSREQRP